MNPNKLINAISYLSVLVAPVLIPLIIWILAKDADVTQNAKKAFWLQIPPFLLIAILLIFIGVIGLTTNDARVTGLTTLILFVVLGVISVGLYIYNIVLGIKSLMSN